MIETFPLGELCGPHCGIAEQQPGETVTRHCEGCHLVNTAVAENNSTMLMYVKAQYPFCWKACVTG